MLLLIDNYDSFTFNLVEAFRGQGCHVVIKRNREITVSECLDLRPSHIVIGPGPGDPSQAGISKSLIERSAGRIPMLGVCLGHQAIAEVYGGKVIRAKSGPMHGKISLIRHENEGIFRSIKQNFGATRYHSLAVDRESFPDCLKVTGTSEDGEIMGICHREHCIEGVQFHPESILTECGPLLFQNFLERKINEKFRQS